MPSKSKFEFEQKRRAQYKANKNPEVDITDTIESLRSGYTEANWAKMKVRPGRVLGFQMEDKRTYLEIGRISDGKYYAKEVELHDPTTVSSHLHHNVDGTGEVPICTDCEVPVSEPANPKGRAKYEARKELHLSDGTPIDQEIDDEG